MKHLGYILLGAFTIAFGISVLAGIVYLFWLAGYWTPIATGIIWVLMVLHSLGETILSEHSEFDPIQPPKPGDGFRIPQDML